MSWCKIHKILFVIGDVPTNNIHVVYIRARLSPLTYKTRVKKVTCDPD